MAIRKRGQSYQVDVAKGPNKRVRWTAASYPEAERLELKIKSWLLEGRTVEAIKLSLSQGTEVVEVPTVIMRDLYQLADREWSKQPRGGNASRAAHLLDLMGWWELDPNKLTVGMVSQMAMQLADEQELSPATVNRYRAALSRMLSAGVEAGLIEKAVKVSQEREPKGRIRWLTRAEEGRILQYWRDKGEDLLLKFTEFMVDTGCRNSEVLSVSSEDIDERGNLRLYRKKTKTDAYLPLSPRAYEALQSVGRFNIGERWLHMKWAKMREDLGLTADVTPYVLRHTCCSRLVNAGMQLFKVQQWMGHASVTTTQRYAHLRADALAEGVIYLEQAA
ncbi:tyrosine-type recombinase/integrase [Shewanella algae]|uniref:tyrosine-type recombinase/integrase n=1 Tax=Shewanella algae TaxID=38313 RepID=UPI00399C2864